MKEKKGYRPFKATLSYMRKMINTGKWKANSRIPTIADICERTKVSASTVRKAVKQLEIERLIDNNGSLGFYVVPPTMTKLFHTDKHLYYLKLIKSNIEAIELIESGGTPIGKFIIMKNGLNITVHNTISGKTIRTNFDELDKSMTDPIQLISLISLKGDKLKEARKKYFAQQDLREIAKVLLKNKEHIA